MLELEHGIVKFFDDRSGKCFGFLEVLDEDSQKTGEELFFHFNDGQFVDIVGGDEIQFVGRFFPDNGLHMSHPRIGDKLAFERTIGKNDRQKACPWTRAEGYDNRVRELTEPYYRVIKRITEQDGEELLLKELVIWEGQRVDKLSDKHPIQVSGGKLDDPLARTVDFEEHSTTLYRFEEWVPDDIVDDAYGGGILVPGFWLPCADPRYRSERAKELMEG